MSFNKSDFAMRMSLEGVGALELYLVAIAGNMGAMSEQVALLRVALAEREALLRGAQRVANKRGMAGNNFSRLEDESPHPTGIDV